MKTEYKESNLVRPKTVIFRHPAAVFNFDKNVRSNAVLIKEQKPEGKTLTGIYYSEEVRRAVDSDKLYIVVNYSRLAAILFEKLLTNSDKYDIMEWHFITFFHDDVSGTEQESQNIPLDLKRDLIISMFQCSYVMKYTVPYGYTLTEQDIKGINDFWKEPDIKSPKDFNELIRNPRKPPFPFYDSLAALREIVSKIEVLSAEAG